MARLTNRQLKVIDEVYLKLHASFVKKYKLTNERIAEWLFKAKTRKGIPPEIAMKHIKNHYQKLWEQYLLNLVK